MKYTTAIALTVGLLPSARFTVKHMPAKEENIMSQDTQRIAGRPDLTVPEVLTKVLDSLRHAKSPEDFKIEMAEKVMKLESLECKDGHSDFYIGSEFRDSDWGWSISFKKTRYGGGRMDLYFRNEGGYLPATPICQMDLDQFHPLIEKAGFTYTGKGHQGRSFNRHTRTYPNGHESHLQVFYQGESKEKVLYDCIKEISFLIFKPGT